jgi:(S)-2-hydroxyglutarate dehydrogenase
VTPGYDYVVVGAGILGLATVRELQRRDPDARIVNVDRAGSVGTAQSGHNSGVIHAGVYYRPGSLKATLCVRGAARLYEYCAERGIEARRVGKLIIATHPAELTGLDQIKRRARSNGVPEIRRLTADEIRQIEPHAVGLAALHSPSTGIVDFTAVCRVLASEAQQAGGELRLGWPVTEISERSGAVVIRGASGDGIEASHAIFCAGLDADRLAVGAGAPADPRIVPFRGAYLRLAPEARGLVRGLIYPVPDPRLPFLGVHLTPQLDGQVILGPTALMVGSRDAYRVTQVRHRDLVDTLSWPGTWRLMRRWWRTGLGELRLAVSRSAFAEQAARYVPQIRASDLAPGFAGIRAQAVGRAGELVDDFVLSETVRTVHVRNAPSPAATSSLALAELIVDRLGERSQ